MDTILNQPISKWALFFHLETQAKYVLELNKKQEAPSFITPLAEEIYRVLSMYRKGKLDIGVNISLSSKSSIIAYIKKYIDVHLSNTKVQPTLMLLASLRALYGEDEDDYFSPMENLLGNQILRDFVDDFDSRVEKSNFKDMYFDTMKTIHRIIYPNSITFSDRRVINRIKEEFSNLIEGSYLNSLSHGMKHIDDVIERSLYLRAKYNIDTDIEETIISALLHDMYNEQDRRNHHILAGRWVESSIHPLLNKSKESKNRIAAAVREHRASYTGEYYSNLSELIATADLDKPEINDILLRMYNYIIDKDPKTDLKVIINEMTQHLIEKYSRDGYIRYPDLYLREYGSKLESLYNTIDRIKSGKVRITIARYAGKVVINLKKK